MPVRMVGATEVWAAGGSSSDNGEMWHTTDLVNWDSISTTTQVRASFFFFFFGIRCILPLHILLLA